MMNISEFFKQREISGQYTFTKNEIKQALHLSQAALNQALWRSKKQLKITEPYRGFFVIIPLAYQNQGCLPPEQFIDELMKYLKQPLYYVALLSAAQFHGVSHQKPQVFQVMIPEKRRAIHCGAFNIVFITKTHIDSTFIQLSKTARGYFNLSTLEATVIDLILYSHRAAGWNNVLTILTELAEALDSSKLMKLVKKIKNNSDLQRLGYLLEKAGARKVSRAVYQYLKIHRQIKPQLFIVKRPIISTTLNKRWQLYINEEIESDV